MTVKRRVSNCSCLYGLGFGFACAHIVSAMSVLVGVGTAMGSVRICAGGCVSAGSLFLERYFFTAFFAHSVLLRPVFDLGPLGFWKNLQLELVLGLASTVHLT